MTKASSTDWSAPLVNGDQIDYSDLPEYMRGGMQRYMEASIRPGDFLCCVLANNLMGAIRHADDENVNLLPLYARWLYNHAPSGSYGSPENFGKWLARRA